jgi:hypothetical protein
MEKGGARGLLPTKWVVVDCRLWVVGDEMGKGGALGLMGCGLLSIVLVGVGLGGREREARMGESLGWRGKEEDGGEMRERELK